MHVCAYLQPPNKEAIKKQRNDEYISCYGTDANNLDRNAESAFSSNISVSFWWINYTHYRGDQRRDAFVQDIRTLSKLSGRILGKEGCRQGKRDTNRGLNVGLKHLSLRFMLKKCAGRLKLLLVLINMMWETKGSKEENTHTHLTSKSIKGKIKTFDYPIKNKFEIT